LLEQQERRDSGKNGTSTAFFGRGWARIARMAADTTRGMWRNGRDKPERPLKKKQKQKKTAR
jgi:hypothetical protein